MIRRFYVNNYRCLENFELPLAAQPSILLIGKNGAGKSTVGFALELLQKIARGTNRVKDLIEFGDISIGKDETPVRFELEVKIAERVYSYTLAFDYPENFKEMRVMEERLTVDAEVLYARDKADVRLGARGGDADPRFSLDWHVVALPIVQVRGEKDPLNIFRQWLERVMVLRPVPCLIDGESSGESLLPNAQVTNFAEWFAGLMAHSPAAYGKVEKYLKLQLPDLQDIKNPVIARDTRSLSIQFSENGRTRSIRFESLSDGEKCFMIWALVLAANEAYGPLVCFWDEPDNYIGISEIGHFVMALRHEFERVGQFIATSHNAESIRRFSGENTFVLYRRSHLEPTQVRPIKEIHSDGDLIQSLILGDLELEANREL